jgi:hypothetical protein
VHHKPSVSVLPTIGGALPAPSLFGINTGTYDKSQADFDRDIPTAAGLGARWDHFTSGSVHFLRNGQPSWTVMDYEVKHARENHMGVLISLGGAATACAISSERANPSECPPTTTRDLTAYKSFVRAELLRYHNDVQYWESWVEPNLNGGWAGHPNPAQYANVLRAQWQAFQSFNGAYHTDMKLIFGGTISFSTGPGGASMAVLPFVHDVLDDLGGARVFDAIALHAYRFPQTNSGPATENWGPTAVDYDYVGGIPNAPGSAGPYPSAGCNQVFGGYCRMDWRGELSAVEQEFANHGYGQMPLWLTEFGWPGTATPSTALYPSETTQAQYLSQAYSVIMGLPFIQAAFWFNLRDYQPGIVSPDPPFFYHYGLLEYGYGQKPAAVAFKALAAANPGR